MRTGSCRAGCAGCATGPLSPVATATAKWAKRRNRSPRPSATFTAARSHRDNSGIRKKRELQRQTDRAERRNAIAAPSHADHPDAVTVMDTSGAPSLRRPFRFALALRQRKGAALDSDAHYAPARRCPTSAKQNHDDFPTFCGARTPSSSLMQKNK